MSFKHKSWDPFVIIFVLACLFIGWLVKEGIESRTVDFVDTNANISLEYPAGWLPMPDANSIFSVFDPQSQSFYNTGIKFTVIMGYADSEERMVDFIEHLRTQRESSYSLYHTISVSPYEIHTLKTTRLDYIYVTFLPEMIVPDVVRAFDIIIPKDNLVYILTFSADESEYERNLSEFNAIASSIRSI